jgi:catechol 2,3-dioxygenase-like lactoylglutathione lyase family enzyme
MVRGNISHIALTVGSLERSTAFYNKVCEFIGFKAVGVPESTQQAMKTRLKAWAGPGYSISSVRRKASSRAGHTIETRLALTIWPLLPRTDWTSRNSTSS